MHTYLIQARVHLSWEIEGDEPIMQFAFTVGHSGCTPTRPLFCALSWQTSLAIMKLLRRPLHFYHLQRYVSMHKATRNKYIILCKLHCNLLSAGILKIGFFRTPLNGIGYFSLQNLHFSQLYIDVHSKDRATKEIKFKKINNLFYTSTQYCLVNQC